MWPSPRGRLLAWMKLSSSVASCVSVRQLATVCVPSVVGQPAIVAGKAVVSVAAPAKVCWYWMNVFVESSYCVSVA